MQVDLAAKKRSWRGGPRCSGRLELVILPNRLFDFEFCPLSTRYRFEHTMVKSDGRGPGSLGCLVNEYRGEGKIVDISIRPVIYTTAQLWWQSELSRNRSQRISDANTVDIKCRRYSCCRQDLSSHLEKGRVDSYCGTRGDSVCGRLPGQIDSNAKRTRHESPDYCVILSGFPVSSPQRAR